ncbi:hypothetical protein LCGC14_1803010 [marine sediment metagenome]|uniref:Uncharacterized protein n=1 Tax=marine sediment metagenome TaxID=412755 RepID=A0A0F9JNN3_9ZZZZ
MNFFKFLDKLKRSYNSLILYCLLDRIPIIVLGDNSEKIDNFLVELSELIHFRKEYIFHTDFISNNEYETIISNENIDYNYQRAHIRCPSNVSLKALSQFDNINSWLIGIVIPKQKEQLFFIKDSINKKTDKLIYITILLNTISIEIIGINLKLIDLTLEQNIFKKISQDTEKSINKMKRVLNDKITVDKLDKDLSNTLLDFKEEKYELKRNIFKREIQNFYSGSKRALFILSRLSLLNSVGFYTRIGSKTLFETIDYEEAAIERIISFISKEWGEVFSNLIQDSKKSFLGDKIVSLWG